MVKIIEVQLQIKKMNQHASLIKGLLRVPAIYCVSASSTFLWSRDSDN